MRETHQQKLIQARLDKKSCQPDFARPLTIEARKYAVKELARRSGVSREFFNAWQIDVASDHTVVTIVPDGNKKIYFQHIAAEKLHDLSKAKLPVGEALWPHGVRNALFEQNFVIPFVETDYERVRPLFEVREDGSFLCKHDLLLSLLFTLCRVEETLSDVRDEHSRFPASASLAIKYGFLERPIVDELGVAFEHVIRALLPAWRPERRMLRMKLTHDIDDIGIPFRLRSAAAHTLKRGKPRASLRDIASTFSNSDPAELAQVRILADISHARGFQSAFFWKGSHRTARDSGYDIFDPKVQRTIAYIKEREFEVGVHPGYDTFESLTALSAEIDRLRAALAVKKIGGRQHYLRWSPQTWHDWETCELFYDSSVGFADYFGFRAGTAIPYRPWSFSQNRELNLIEIPLIVMDCTPVKYVRLPKIEALHRIGLCIKRTALVGGVFTLLWHNNPLLEPEYDGWYESILDLLPSVQDYSLPDSVQSLW